MGTYVTAFLEEKDGTTWKFVEKVDLPQNYDLFALLNRVRNYYRCIPIVQDRPFPSDLSPEVRTQYDAAQESQDAFAYGYLTANDLIGYQHWDTPFPDTRTLLPGNEDGDSGGISDYEEEQGQKIDPKKYAIISPRQVIDGLPPVKAFLKKLRASSTARLIFWYS